MSLEDLGEVERRIRAREKYERRQKNPMYVKFDDEEVPSLDFADLEKKYGGQSSRRLSGDGSAYYLDAKATDGGAAGQARGQLDRPRLLPQGGGPGRGACWPSRTSSRYGPNFKIQLTGTYKKKIDQQAQIARDLSSASTVALVLLLGYLLFHFRSAVAVLLNLAPVMVSLVWTYGIVGAGSTGRSTC